jgi:hypothetical protein
LTVAVLLSPFTAIFSVITQLLMATFNLHRARHYFTDRRGDPRRTDEWPPAPPRARINEKLTLRGAAR